MVKAVFTGMLFLGLCMYLLKITDVSRIMMGIFFLLNIALLGLSKGITYGLLTKFRRQGYNFRNLLIIGARELRNRDYRCRWEPLGKWVQGFGLPDRRSHGSRKSCEKQYPGHRYN